MDGIVARLRHAFDAPRIHTLHATNLEESSDIVSRYALSSDVLVYIEQGTPHLSVMGEPEIIHRIAADLMAVGFSSQVGGDA